MRSFEEVSGRWLACLSTYRSLRDVQKYKATLRRYVLPIIGSKTIENLDPADCAKVLANAQSENQRFGLARILKSILRWHFGEVPLYLRPVLKVRQPRPLTQTLSLEEQRQLLQFAANNLDCDFGLGILLLWGCGLRIGELLGLRYEDFNSADNSLILRRSFSNGEVKALKAGSSEWRVLIPQIAVQFMKNNRKGWVFPAAINSKRPLSLSTAHAKFFNTLRAAGVSRVKVHSFRHAWVTRMLDAGAPFKAVQVQGGWASYKTPLDTYYRYSDGNLQAISEINEKFLGGVK